MLRVIVAGLVVWQTGHGRAKQLSSWQLGKPEYQKGWGQSMSPKRGALPPRLDRHLSWIPRAHTEVEGKNQIYSIHF